MNPRSESSSIESTDTLLLYCPYDRRVTRHARRGRESALVCLECGRKLEAADRERMPAGEQVDEQRTTAIAPVTESAHSRRSTRAIRTRQSRGSWLAVILVCLAVLAGALAAVNILGNLMAPRPEPAQGLANSSREEVASVEIANTEGVGAYIRRTPDLDDRLRAWPDGTRLKVVGPDMSANGIEWKQVEDPAGNRGWIPAQYTSREPAP